MPSETLSNPDLAEEIDAINAIYGSSTVVLPPTSSSTEPTATTIILNVPEHTQISFIVRFDEKYPETAPRVTGTASTGLRGEGKKWVDILSEAVLRVWTPGSVCLYDLIVEAGERFDEVRASEQEAKDIENGRKQEEQEDNYPQQLGDLDIHGPSSGQALLASIGLKVAPSWIMSDPITEKKSVFLARAAHVKSKEEAEKYLDYLLATEKKVAAATHNITAWRIKQKKADGSDTVVQDFDDDGETAAGGRMLHLMQLMDVWDVVVVVTRWYGGVKLGPDRFRIINAAARDALVKGGFEKSAATNGQEKGKKKGKR
ncbi:impact family protein [Coccidioides immitis RS]|uniref:Impact family protein n=1 Tax=Coccidioides immitis (strain RS) TaxID=246410 RepID=J3K892_COCIM|nr:impact family protein [Coccidioides immitis RS]EAS31021.3 impact family protein [Coccidioides immitis RS]TPX23883.1 eIF2 kinase Gcn2p negative regulator [Coccidioides immitis]